MNVVFKEKSVIWKASSRTKVLAIGDNGSEYKREELCVNLEMPLKPFAKLNLISADLVRTGESATM